MELTAEIRELLLSAGQVKHLELTYRNGGKVTGTIRKVRRSPLRVVIEKSDPEAGERPRHRALFDHVTSLRITLVDGTVREFS